MSWHDVAVGTYAHEVATRWPNAWGIYDMSGNVSEWTNDWIDSGHGGYADGKSDVDPAGPVTGSGEGCEGYNHVFRGGDWGNHASNAAVSHREYGAAPNYAGYVSGFRLSRSSR
ncbi:MAG: hypothetical protein EXR71_13570 [Myxococcales bacterium]|nr:hypothetical protein [Myxococcales bacterium]